MFITIFYTFCYSQINHYLCTLNQLYYMKYFKEILFGLTMIGIMIAIGFENWKILLVVPVAITNAYINACAIKDNKFGDLWHDLQFAILFVILATLIILKLIAPDEILLYIGLYYASFEIPLNLFRGRKANYTGHSSLMDKTIRSIFKKEMYINSMFWIIKLFLIIGGFSWFIANKPS